MYEAYSLIYLVGLDSYINIVIVEKSAVIENDADVKVCVSSFTSCCETLSKVPIVNTAIRCYFMSTDATYLLIVRNDRNVLAFNHHLVSTFIVR